MSGESWWDRWVAGWGRTGSAIEGGLAGLLLGLTAGAAGALALGAAVLIPALAGGLVGALFMARVAWRSFSDGPRRDGPPEGPAR
jgi:hypothetical protein